MWKNRKNASISLRMSSQQTKSISYSDRVFGWEAKLKNTRSIVFSLLLVGPIFASSLLNRLHIMMTTMLALTVLTLIALIFVLQRLRPLSQKPLPVESKDANNNLNSSSPPADDLDESAVSLTSKNRYITLVQHDDEQNSSSCPTNGKSNSLVKLLSNNLDGQQQRSSANNSLHFGTSSTNILCLSDDTHRTLKNETIDSPTSHSWWTELSRTSFFFSSQSKCIFLPRSPAQHSMITDGGQCELFPII